MLWKALMCAAVVALPCVLPGCGSSGSQQAEQGLAYVRVDSIRQWVSIDAANASVQSILLELSKQAGLSLSTPDGGELGRITLAIKNVSIEEGIQHVLGSTPYTLRYGVGENGQRTVAAVEVRRGMPDHSDSPKPESSTSVAGARTGDFGWGADRGRDGGLPGDSDRVAELAATLKDLSLDTVKQLMSEAKDPVLRASMLDALTERDDQRSVRPLFLEALQDADADVRGAALEHLQASYDLIPLASLADAVARETNSALRTDALALLSDQALAEGRAKEDLAIALASATRALADPDPAVREQAQWSLEELSQAGIK